MVTVSVPVMDNNGTTFDLDQCRAAIRAATAAVTELVGLLTQVEDAELGPLLGTLDQLAALAEGARAALIREAESRGETLRVAGRVDVWVGR